MRYLVTGKEMKLLDENTSQNFKIPPIVLMEQAANAFVRELFSVCKKMQNVLIVCGNGNNGGDGVAIARLLNQLGISATVLLWTTSRLSELLSQQIDIYRNYGYPEFEDFHISELTVGDSATGDSYTSVFSQFDVIVDALYGTGLNRNIEGATEILLRQLNHAEALRIAVDIPSGVSGEDGHICGIAFQADVTITFSFEKVGHYLYPGSSCCGRLINTPIGITQESMLDHKPRLRILEEDDIKSRMPARHGNTHKGTYGKLLIVAGSPNMAGAAAFASKSAYRSGCGLVKIFSVEENREILQILSPEAILETYSKSIDRQKIAEAVKWADAILIGPGLGTGRSAHELFQEVLADSTVPVILDADALNMVAENTDILLRPHMDLILTPHIGEFSRLTGNPVSYIETHFIDSAREFADRYNVTLHLKGARSITAVPYGASFLTVNGNSGMSTAGSGDVLAGIIASLAAQGVSAEYSAAMGAYIHASSGDFYSAKHNRTSLTAGDLINELSNLAYLE